MKFRLPLLILILSVALAATASAQAGSGPMYTVQQRFGVGVARQYGDITSYDTSVLNIGWYMDWGYRSDPARPGGIDYAQLVTTRPSAFPPDWTALGAAVQANPGSMWFIGNEPDGAPGVQDSQVPETYAAAYHDIYTFIKGLDSTARLGPGGVIEPTPLRLRYLDLVLSAYQTQYGVALPADFWATHVQILPERRGEWGAGIPTGIADNEGRTYYVEENADPAVFEQLVRELRTWMAERGLRNMPLIISEYGVLMPSLYVCYCYDHALGDAMVVNFMTRSFDFMLSARDADLGYAADENRLVQRWSWYSLNEKPYDMPPYGSGYNGPLFDYRTTQFPGVLTLFGQAYRNYTEGLSTPYRRYLPTIQAQ